MNIVILSLWRLDALRDIHARMEHLLSKKSVGNSVRWLWVVGDSNDETESILRSTGNPHVTVVRYDSRVEGDDARTCRIRGAWTASQLFRHIEESDDIACLHESDLHSSEFVLDEFLAGPLPAAGWPVIKFEHHTQFYDIWAYRNLHGAKFAPFEERRDQPFCVDSFGSCWVVPAALLRDRVIGAEAVVDLCKQWRDEGIDLWVNPNIEIEQPTALWRAM